MAKRDCFPARPPAPTVVIPEPCRLPPPIELPAVAATQPAANTVCFSVEMARRIAEREAAMKRWIGEAKAACGTKP